MESVALVWVAPVGLQDGALVAHIPLEAIKVLPRGISNLPAHKIHECIPKRQHCLEICRDIQEVVLTSESIVVEQQAEIRSHG
jgi:hypothetical protein